MMIVVSRYWTVSADRKSATARQKIVWSSTRIGSTSTDEVIGKRKAIIRAKSTGSESRKLTSDEKTIAIGKTSAGKATLFRSEEFCVTLVVLRLTTVAT